MYVGIESLIGLTLHSVTRSAKDAYVDYIKFIASDGRCFIMHHNQTCVEEVYIVDINGELNDLVGVPILSAEQSSSNTHPPDVGERYDGGDGAESFTWTFYKLATIKGYVTIRWYGSSNGYYSEEVDFEELDRDNVIAAIIKFTGQVVFTNFEALIFADFCEDYGDPMQEEIRARYSL